MRDAVSVIAGSARSPAPGYVLVSEGLLEEATVSVSFWINPKDPGWRSQFTSMTSAPISQREYLNLRDTDTKYAPRPDVVAAVKAFATKYRLDVVAELSSLRLITLEVPTAMVKQLFGTELGTYASGETTYRGRQGPIMLPQEDFPQDIIDGIGGVFGLDNRVQATSFLRTIPVEGFPVHGAFPPASYGFPSEAVSPPTQKPDPELPFTIAIVAFGGTKANYLAACPNGGAIVVFSQPNIKQERPEFATEICTDLRVISLCAGSAKVALYMADATEQGWVMALHAILSTDPAPSVVSISWGWPEGDGQGTDLWTESAIQTVEQILALLALRGATVCVSSGDSGPFISYPGSSAYVLSCGGTQAATGSDSVSEEVWNPRTGDSSGGGISSQIELPDWQKGSSIATQGDPQKNNQDVANVAYRLLPDVAARAVLMPNAGPADPTSGTDSLQGTSIAAPLWASLFALVNAALASKDLKPVGNVNGLLYAKGANLQQTLTDVICGNNGRNGQYAPFFSASLGWDACTGWGTPKVRELIDALEASAFPPRVSRNISSLVSNL